MQEQSNEDRVADHVLGFDKEGHAGPASASTEKDHAAHELEREMRETMSALQAWRRQLEAQPVRLPVSRHRISWSWPAGIAAALVIGFGFNFWAIYRGNSSAIVRELDWTAPPRSVSEPGPVHEITVHLVPSTSKVGAGASGPATSQSVRLAHSPSGIDAATARAIRHRAAFAFRMPDRLSGSLALHRVESVGSNHVHLVYVGDSGTMAVFLSRSPGPDITMREVRIGTRTLMAGRRHGVLAAFDAPGLSARDWNDLLRDFVNGDQTGG